MFYSCSIALAYQQEGASLIIDYTFGSLVFVTYDYSASNPKLISSQATVIANAFRVSDLGYVEN